MNVLVAMMAGFGVLSTLLASVLDGSERSASSARSGPTRGQVAIGVLAEALLLGALGLVVGCLLGMLGARVLVNIFDVFNWHVPFVVPVGALVVELTLILLVVLAAGWYPARRAGGLALVEGLAAEWGAHDPARGRHARIRQGRRMRASLVDIDTTISRGEFVSLMGPSGSGKSTLLHLIGGIDTPSRGEIDRRRAPPLGDD